MKRIIHGVIFLGLLVSLLALKPAQPASAAGTIRYVNDNAAGSNDGSSWANAYTRLQDALSAAQVGDQIWVAAGTYKPTTDPNRIASFNLKTGVAIYGGFAGTETVLTERNPSVNVTVLSGDIGTVGDASDNSYHVVNGSSTNSASVLDGFTVTGGNADSINPNDLGAGIYIVTGASPTLSNLIVSGNHVLARGGGMYTHVGSKPILTNVVFIGNSAGDTGGGFYSMNASPKLTNVTFTGNTAGNKGGGMYVTDGGVPVLNNVTFKGNSATSAGGGIGVAITNPTLTNVSFSGNTAPFGGAMHNIGSDPTLTNVTFKGNTASTEGGAIYNASSSPIISNSIIYGNTGGEIVNSSGTPDVSFSIVKGGYAGLGNVDANPLLSSLANNGGFTQTMAFGKGSPALDTGNPATCAATDQRGIARPQGIACDKGAFEMEHFSKAFRSIAAHDGWILESAEGTGKGGGKNNSDPLFRLGDEAGDRQYRAILSFNTSALPDDAVITKVTLKIKQSGAPVGGNPFEAIGNGIRIDVRKPFFGPSAALTSGDFEAAASQSQIGSIFNAPQANNWYGKVWNTDTFFSFINQTGVTQFRLRFKYSDNNNGIADYMKFFSGDHPTAGNRPMLIIQYYVP